MFSAIVSSVILASKITKAHLLGCASVLSFSQNRRHPVRISSPALPPAGGVALYGNCSAIIQIVIFYEIVVCAIATSMRMLPEAVQKAPVTWH